MTLLRRRRRRLAADRMFAQVVASQHGHNSVDDEVNLRAPVDASVDAGARTHARADLRHAEHEVERVVKIRVARAAFDPQRPARFGSVVTTTRQAQRALPEERCQDKEEEAGDDDDDNERDVLRVRAVTSERASERQLLGRTRTTSKSKGKSATASAMSPTAG